jgi:hypothetical protein
MAASFLVLLSGLFVTSIALLSLSALFILAGWYHHHVAVPVATWFNDVDAILNHHLAVAVTFLVAGHLYRTQFRDSTHVLTGVT